VVVLVGEAGMGKSRLLQTLASDTTRFAARQRAPR
jgi:putative ribosome biogenesis GTPase RsgA